MSDFRGSFFCRFLSFKRILGKHLDTLGLLFELGRKHGRPYEAHAVFEQYCPGHFSSVVLLWREDYPESTLTSKKHNWVLPYWFAESPSPSTTLRGKKSANNHTFTKNKCNATVSYTRSPCVGSSNQISSLLILLELQFLTS